MELGFKVSLQACGFSHESPWEVCHQFKNAHGGQETRCGVEGLELISSRELTKIRANGWTAIDKKAGTCLKRSYIQRQRGYHSKTVRGPHPWQWKTHIIKKWIFYSGPWYLHMCFKLKILSQRFLSTFSKALLTSLSTKTDAPRRYTTHLRWLHSLRSTGPG